MPKRRIASSISADTHIFILSSSILVSEPCTYPTFYTHMYTICPCMHVPHSIVQHIWTHLTICRLLCMNAYCHSSTNHTGLTINNNNFGRTKKDPIIIDAEDRRATMTLLHRHLYRWLLVPCLREWWSRWSGGDRGQKGRKVEENCNLNGIIGDLEGGCMKTPHTRSNEDLKIKSCLVYVKDRWPHTRQRLMTAVARTCWAYEIELVCIQQKEGINLK